jgi:type I restriction enzyme S subunit
MSLKKIKQLFNIEKGVLQSSKCIEGEYDFITAAADWKTHNEYTHDCEALIFAAAASGSLGRTHYVNGKFISSDLCFILTPKEPEKLPVNLRFYHIIFNLYKNEIVAATKAGTSKEAIGLRVFGEYELPYFDISIQQKVKAEFGKAEALKNDLFDEYTYQLTLLENLNQAILQEAVQGKLVPQDPNDEPASELLKRIKAEKATLRQAQGKGKKEKPLPPIKPEDLPAGKAGIPFEIPENWVWCRLGEIIEYTENLDIQKHLSPDTIINYVDIDAIDNQNFVIREAKQKTVSELSTRARRILKPNYIVYSTVRPYLKNIAIVEDEKDNYIGSTGFNVFKTLDVELKYAFYYLLTPYVNNSFKDLMVGFNSPSITNDQFEKSLFPLPPLSEQKRIVAEIEKQLAKTKQLKEHIIANQQATEQLLKALLHQAFEVKEMVIAKPKGKVIELKPTNVDYYRRTVLAAEIVWQLHKEPTLGHLKLQKLIYLCQKSADMQLPTNFLRQAMGPYDNRLMRSIDKQLKEKKWFEFKKEQVLKYQPLEKAGQHHNDFIKYFSAESEGIQFIIDKFRNVLSREIEIWATLYACMDNMLNENVIFSEASLLQRFYEWSEEKKKFSEDQIKRVFSRMKETGIIPKGFNL